jgi:quinol monooxygenase YgiN
LRILASEGQRQELLDAFAEIAVKVLQEEGCIAYEVMVDAVTGIER